MMHGDIYGMVLLCDTAVHPECSAPPTLHWDTMVF